MQKEDDQRQSLVIVPNQLELNGVSGGSDQAHREITRGVVTVAGFVLLGKLAGATKEMVIAWRYGVNAEVDAYLFLFNLVNWPVSLWLSLMTSVLVPVLAKAEHGELRRFKEEFLGRSLIFGTVATAIVAVTMLGLLNSSLTGLPDNAVIAARGLVLQMSLLMPMGVLIGLFSVALLATGRHANTLLESIPAIVIVAVILISGSGSIEVLAWATLAGFTCHAACLAIPLRGEIRVPRYSGDSAYWSAFWTGFSIMLIGQVFTSMTGLVDQFFAARLPEGALSTMSYAQRILSLILGLGATAVGRALIPVIARSTDSDRLHLHGITIRWVQIVFSAGILFILLGWWLAPWGVSLLFERGAFTAQDTQAVVKVFRVGLFQIPFNFSAVILFYALIRRRLYAGLTVTAAVTLLIKLCANAFFMPIYGINGIMWSTTITYAILMFMYLYMFRSTLNVSR